MDVNAAVHLLPRRVVHSWDGAPKRDAAKVLVQIKRQGLISPDGDLVCPAAPDRLRAALRRGIGPMGTAPVARAAVAALFDRDHIARHVGAGNIECGKYAWTKQRQLLGVLALRCHVISSLDRYFRSLDRQAKRAVQPMKQLLRSGLTCRVLHCIQQHSQLVNL